MSESAKDADREQQIGQIVDSVDRPYAYMCFSCSVMRLEDPEGECPACGEYDVACVGFGGGE